MSKGKILVSSRYSVLPNNGCKGQCEGTGFVPVHRDETEPAWKRLWNEAEKKSRSLDGWHFVKCPDCQGTGKQLKLKR